MTQFLFRNFALLEPDAGELQNGFELLVEGDKVKEVSGKPGVVTALTPASRNTLSTSPALHRMRVGPRPFSRPRSGPRPMAG